MNIPSGNELRALVPKRIGEMEVEGLGMVSRVKIKALRVDEGTYRNHAGRLIEGKPYIFVANPDHTYARVIPKGGAQVPNRFNTYWIMLPVRVVSEWLSWKERFQKSHSCMAPIQEGPHLRACLEPAYKTTHDGCPLCAEHGHLKSVRKGWRGFVEGA